jgi:predicted XRE-type DNA-binding protein
MEKYPHGPIHFRDLQQTLLMELQRQIRNGALTERRLALMVGFSQPHIHHVLKGKRTLSLEATDAILNRLGIDVRDLIGSAQLPPIG